MPTVRVFPGLEPHEGLALANDETCVARFLDDPDGRVWVCARVAGAIYGAPLSRDAEWMIPG